MSEAPKPYFSSIEDEFAIAAPVVAPAKKTEQPRDDQGRFAQQEKPFKKVIDLKDGSGVQVFEADTADELIDKLATAQENATKKIKEQNKLLKSRTVVMTPDQKKSAPRQYQPKPLSQDEQFIIGQQFAQNPADAFKRLFEAETGMSLDEFRSKAAAMDAMEKSQSQATAAFEFIVAHQEDYDPTPENEAKITDFLNSNGLEMTRQNLEFAFTQLSAVDALTAPELEEEVPVVNEPPETRIEKPVAQKRATGLSDRNAVRREAPTSVPSVEEIQTLPLEQARDRIIRAMYEQRMGRSSQ